MQNSPKRNDGRSKQADHSETLIIPHITKEMVALAKQMADEGKSRAEIEQAIAALQPGAATVLHRAAETAATKPGKVQRGRLPWQRTPAAPQPPAALTPDTAATKTIQLPTTPAAPADTAPDFAPQPAPVAPLVPAAPAAPPQAAIPQPTPQAAPQPTPQPKDVAAKAPRHVAPRTREEAQQELNERIRADHIWLSNPVLVRGLGLAPIVGAATNLQNALMLCVATLILITATRGIAVMLCHLTKNRFRAPIYAYTAALLYVPTYMLLYELFGTNVMLLGIYLPILTVEPAIVKRMEFVELESVREAWRHGLNNGIGMCVALLLVGALRELLATGAVAGRVVVDRALLPLAAQTAGGFIIVGIIAAVWCAVANAYTDYKREEVRRLYASRKR